MRSPIFFDDITIKKIEKMKSYKINEDQVKLIKNALQYVYDSKLDNIKQSRKIMSEIEIEKTIETANKYYDIQDIFDN